jgi:hypothetical protein
LGNSGFEKFQAIPVSGKNKDTCITGPETDPETVAYLK